MLSSTMRDIRVSCYFIRNKSWYIYCRVWEDIRDINIASVRQSALHNSGSDLVHDPV